MLHSLTKIHRFFNSQALYPIILSTFLALTFFIGRILYSRTWGDYGILPWNLFLAWIPYLFGILAGAIYRFMPSYSWLLLPVGVLWIIFFPNAPYIVTDFLHLEYRPPVPLWYDILMLATFAWTGCFLAIVSLRTMQFLVRHTMGRWISWVFAAAALGLGGLGIYLGRFERFNSWDLLFHPLRIARNVLGPLTNPMDNLRFFGFTLMFTAFLVVLYWVFASISQLDDPDGENKGNKSG